MNKNKHFIIIAGESSGDEHGAQLIKGLRHQVPEASFSGLGGPKMEKAGFVSLVSMDKLAIMGFWEVLKNIIFFLHLERLVLRHIKEVRPHKIILIDYPGFNLRIAKKIKHLWKIKIIYYISPQLWAWKEKRISVIKQYIDSLIVLFPFEVSWYKKRNINVKYFGHPLVEKNLSTTKPPSNKKTSYNIAICPGSRQQEIKQHLPILMDMIKQTQNCSMNLNFEVFCAPNIQPSFLESFIEDGRAHINRGAILKSFKNIDFAFVASGTASLECAITLTPMVVIYKTSSLSWWTTKMFIKTPFASSVNILANKSIVLEVLQNNLTASQLVVVLQEYLHNPQKLQQKQNEILEIIKPLALKNAYEQTSSYIANY